MYRFRRAAILSSCLGGVIFVLWLLPLLLNPTPPTPEQRRRDQAWVQTSPYWLDRQACRLLGLCGTHHLRRDPAERPRRFPDDGNNGDNGDSGDHGDGDLRLELRSLSLPVDSHQWRARESLGEESWEIADTASTFAQTKRSLTRERQKQQSRHERRFRSSRADQPDRAIPDYVLAYAPLVHLYSDEHFWPSHIGEHLEHMKAFTNGTPIADANWQLSLDSLADLNAKTSKVFLTSMDNVEDRPEWLHSHANRPSPFTDPGNDEDGARSKGERTVRRPFADDTTWFSVDRDLPLHHLSDPRKIERLDKHPRRWGPEEAQSRRERARSMADEQRQKPLGESGESSDSSANTVSGDGDSPESGPVPPSHGHKPDESGYSKAPAILVMVDKGSGILDAFWFFFYSYNLGQTVLGVRYGNHVGDWEHCMIRFEDGVPRALFMSEHEGGQAYAWSALEKMKPSNSSDGIRDGATGVVPPRPVLYSAVGSHAMYAVPGTHPYVLPFEMLRDETDKGPLWDPAKNNLAYFYDYASDDDSGEIEDSDKDAGDDSPSLRSLMPAASNAEAPTSWFHFKGPWGDELYDLGDERQWRLFGQYHYITGPVGPKFKNLQRRKVCQKERCRLLYSLDESGTWY